MIIMLIPAFVIFISLRNSTCKQNTLSKVVIHSVRYFTLFSLAISIIMMILGGYPNLGMQSTYDLYQTVFWIVYVYSGYKLLDVLLGITFNKKTKASQIRSLIESMVGESKRSGIRYWLKSLLATLAFVLFIVCLLLSFNVHSARIIDTWNTVLYKGVDILGINIIPMIDIVESLIILLFVYCTSKVTIFIFNIKILPYTKLDLSAKQATIAVINYIFIMIGVIMFIKSLGISNTSIAFIVSGLSVGMGFAMKDLVGDFLAGLVMIFERPVRIDDYVTVNNEIGIIKKIRIRSTEVLTFNNDSLIVPNSVMMNQVISNETLEPVSRLVLPIRISYKEDFRKVINICEKAATYHKDILANPRPECLLTDYGESALEVSIRAYCLRSKRIYVLSDLRKDVILGLHGNNIDIALNKMDINLNDIEK